MLDPPFEEGLQVRRDADRERVVGVQLQRVLGGGERARSLAGSVERHSPSTKFRRHAA